MNTHIKHNKPTHLPVTFLPFLLFSLLTVAPASPGLLKRVIHSNVHGTPNPRIQEETKKKGVATHLSGKKKKAKSKKINQLYSQIHATVHISSLIQEEKKDDQTRAVEENKKVKYA